MNELGEKPDYKVEKFCRHCRKTYPKTERRCAICKNLLRTMPKASKDKRKYTDSKPRI